MQCIKDAVHFGPRAPQGLQLFSAVFFSLSCYCISQVAMSSDIFKVETQKQLGFVWVSNQV